jgi:putative copper resistance protein D
MLAMAGMSPLLFSWHVVLTHWEFAPFPLCTLAFLILVAYWYLQADWRLTQRGRTWSSKRTASFLIGLLTLDLAIQSPVAALTMSYFQAHVIQHLLLMVIAPPLLAMGAPMTLALQTTSRHTKTFLLRLLNSRAFKVLTHPLTVWFLYYATMFAFFLTFALQYAMNHMWVMDLINIAFFGASTLFWWPIVATDPIPHWKMSHGMRLVNLMIGIPVESFLGLTLLGQRGPAASMYTVASTHSGGGLLWVGAELFTMLAMIPVFLQWLRAENRKTARDDARDDAEILEANGGVFDPRALTPVPWQ